MSPRRFQRRVSGYAWRRERENEREQQIAENRFFNTLNAVGLAMNGTDWRMITPESVEETPGFAERWERAEEQERQYIEKIHSEDT